MNDVTIRKKLSVREGKGTVGNALQSAQSASHLNHPAKELTNKIFAPNTAKHLVLKHR